MQNNPFQELSESLQRIEAKLGNIDFKMFNPPIVAEPDILNIEQAGEVLRLAKQTMYILVSKGKIPYMKKGKKLYFSRAEIEQYIRSGKRLTSGQADVLVNDYLTSKSK
jgi:excisionase family DNA binding protein